MARKTSQEIAKESLEIAERVHEKNVARAAKTKADAEKAADDVKFSEKRLRAARLLALDEDTAAEPEPANADVL